MRDLEATPFVIKFILCMLALTATPACELFRPQTFEEEEESCAEANLDCGAHGDCDDSSGQARCLCAEGYRGSTCGVCADGYRDADRDGVCAPSCELAALDCGANGRCDDSSGEATCTCDQGHSGERCEVACEGDACTKDEHCEESSCNGHGVCDDTSGEVECSCEQAYSGQSCELCNEGYGKQPGSSECVPLCDTLDCNGHGACMLSSGSPVCMCDEGYMGTECESCDAGFQDNDGDGVCEASCQPDTCEQGEVCDDSSGAIACDCEEGYAGESCDMCAPGYQSNGPGGTCEPGCVSDSCREGEVCDDSSGMIMCGCIEGYTGANCGMCDTNFQDNDNDSTCEPACAQDACPMDRVCDDSSGAIACDCEEGYAGTDCDICATGYQDENGDGVCTPDCTQVSPTCDVNRYEQCIINQGTAECVALPETCAEMRDILQPGQRTDGFYQLHLNSNLGQAWTAWCHEMATSTPTSYLPLSFTTGESNTFTNLWPQPEGGIPVYTTTYRMVRIDTAPQVGGPVIFLDDTRFATTKYFDANQAGSPSPAEMNGEFMLYGTVNSDAMPPMNQGFSLPGPHISKGTIDLRNTPFRIDPAQMFQSFDRPSVCDPVVNGTGSIVFGLGTKFVELSVSENSNLGPSSARTLYGLRCSTPSQMDISENPGTPLVLSVLYDAPVPSSPLYHPMTCAEVQQRTSMQNPPDGVYTLYHQRDPNQQWPAWCAGMSTTSPKEYLTLPRQMGASNAFNRFVGTKEDVIRYQRVRIDPFTLDVDVTDKTFATVLTTAPPSLADMPDYGTVYTQNSASVAMGTIDLRGTSFVVAPDLFGFDSPFGAENCDTTVSATFSEGDRRVDITSQNPSPTEAYGISPTRRSRFQQLQNPCPNIIPFPTYASDDAFILRLGYRP